MNDKPKARRLTPEQIEERELDRIYEELCDGHPSLMEKWPEGRPNPDCREYGCSVCGGRGTLRVLDKPKLQTCPGEDDEEA